MRESGKNVSKFLLVFFAVAGSYTSFSQSNLLNAKTPDEIGKKTAAQMNADNDKPLPYGYVHDRDVLMGKTTWEIIDLDERVNFPLYYPIDTANIGTAGRIAKIWAGNGLDSENIREYADGRWTKAPRLATFPAKENLKNNECICPKC